MIIFKKLRYCNIFSTGNQFTEIDFRRSKSTLIVGENGAGKSTLLDALCFVLFGKPFRNINKPQLVNSITKKGLLVEVEFSIGTKEFLVRRGIKPNIFEIFQNEKLIDQSASVGEYQEVLEKTILKMNMKSFTQVVILGSADYVPFMKLSTPDRRVVIEDFLDLQIFSVMNTVLKKRISENSEAILDNDHKIDLVERSIDLHERNIKSIQTNTGEVIQAKQDQIKRLELQIDHENQLICDNQEKLNKLNLEIRDARKLEQRKEKLKSFEIDFGVKSKNFQKEITFFEDNDNCPTCKQEITADFKESRKKNRLEKIENINEALTKLKEEFIIVNQAIEQIDEIKGKCLDVTSTISKSLFQVSVWKNSVTDLQKEIRELEGSNKQININEDEISSLREQKDLLVDEKFKLIEQKNLLNISANFLKDTGIKTKIIRQYIPIINQIVNQNLAALDFFVNFELDEKFNETIRSRFRDDFSYSSFSEGEKFRIDVSLMFTWRAIAKMRNSAATNLLIMDEVCDGSLDDSGVDDLMKMINAFAQDTNVFVISHKGDSLFDKFHSNIKFVKEKNFSRIA